MLLPLLLPGWLAAALQHAYQFRPATAACQTLNEVLHWTYSVKSSTCVIILQQLIHGKLAQNAGCDDQAQPAAATTVVVKFTGAALFHLL
jgi:hypothetical protein